MSISIEELIGRNVDIETSVSWDGTGLYDGPLDNLSEPNRRIQGSLRIRRGKDEALPAGRPMVPEFSFEVQNEDRELSPAYAGSSIYRLVRPNKPARVIFRAGAGIDYNADIRYTEDIPYNGAIETTLVTGLTRQPQQRTAPGDRTVSLSARGQMGRLQTDTISTPLYESIRTDEAIGIILDLAGWPADKRDLSVGDTTMQWWFLDDAEPFAAIVELLDTEGIPAAIFERGDGTLVFQNRNYRTTNPRSTSPVASFQDHFESILGYNDAIDYNAETDYNGGTGLFHSGIEDLTTYEDVFNAARMTVRRRAVSLLKKVGEYGEALVLSAGQTYDMAITTSDPCYSFTAPVDGTDYTVSAGSLASTPTMVGLNAQRPVVRWVAGGSGATILGVTSNGPQLQATVAEVIREVPITHSLDTSTSVAENDGRISVFNVQARQEISESAARSLCDSAVLHQQFARPRVRVTVKNIDARHLIYQVDLDVSDAIGVQSSHLGYGVNQEPGDFWIDQIDYENAPEAFVATFTCQQILPTPDGGLWDDALWDSDIWSL